MEDEELMKQVKVTCPIDKGRKLKSQETSIHSAKVIVSKIDNCTYVTRYRCLPTGKTNAVGEYEYTWQDDVEKTTSPGFPACGRRSYCNLSEITYNDPTCKLPSEPKK
jgi:hypothetical protein